MRQQIAHRLATNRSPTDAQNFIRQFQGQPGYERLQASVISGIAQTDIGTARQLAEQLVDDAARSRAYAGIIERHAQTDPADAARWLNNISDESLRGRSAGRVAAHWYTRDPASATRWVSNLPAGSARDDAIMHMSGSWREPTAETEALVASIQDRDKRGQAKMQQIYRVIRTNPARAREMLQDEDFSSYQRQQIEAMIDGGMRF